MKLYILNLYIQHKIYLKMKQQQIPLFTNCFVILGILCTIAYCIFKIITFIFMFVTILNIGFHSCIYISMLLLISIITLIINSCVNGSTCYTIFHIIICSIIFGLSIYFLTIDYDCNSEHYNLIRTSLILMSIMYGIYLSVILITASLMLGIGLGTILYCYAYNTELDIECLNQIYNTINSINDTTINICFCSFFKNSDNNNYYRII